jgi:MoaA/NifB/PqqE/SkfB family radical SAM enzyme
MYSYSDIRHVHLEISTRCNAACPGCPRNLCGVDIVEGYPLHDMTLTEAQRIFPTIFLKQLNSILINGNLGDFVTAQDGLEIVRYFREQNPRLKITINTNAGARPGIWTELAKLNVEILFCIDGLKNTHELYRRQTKWETVISHAQLFIQSGGNATWKMILFDHNQHEIEQCKKLSQDLGFKRFEVIDHGRNAFPVFDQKKTYLYSIGQTTRPIEFTELYNQYLDGTINGYIEPVDINEVECQVSKKKSVYITATGEIYPCCWLGFYPRTMWQMGNSQIIPLLPNNNNANQNGIESAIQWFSQVKKSWKSNPLVQCKINCGIKTDNQ